MKILKMKLKLKNQQIYSKIGSKRLKILSTQKRDQFLEIRVGLREEEIKNPEKIDPHQVKC